MLSQYDWMTAVCALISFVAMLVPLFLFRAPKLPTDEFRQDFVVVSSGGIGVQAKKAFEKYNEEMSRAFRWQVVYTIIAILFLVLSILFQLAAKAIS